MVYDRRLTYGSGGNISARLDNDTILITPSGTCKGLMDPRNMIKVDIDSGKAVGDKRPSMETPFHLAFYRSREEAGAVIHSHPLNCTVLAVTGNRLRSAITPEGLLMLGDYVPMVDYATPGTEDLATFIINGIGTSNVCLLRSHGALAVGGNLMEAFNRLETMEYIATLQLKCEQIGDLEELPEEEIERILGK